MLVTIAEDQQPTRNTLMRPVANNSWDARAHSNLLETQPYCARSTRSTNKEAVEAVVLTTTGLLLGYLEALAA